jgi:hypothetical protein
MLKKIEKTFKDLLSNKDYETPGTPSFNVIRPKSDEDKVTEEQQKIYRSGVGSLLQLVKYSRPDIANIVRELAKCMDGATPEAFKELTRVLQFVVNTKDYGLLIEPKWDKNNQWNLVVYTDSDWAGDKENRHSVTGYIMFLMGVPVMWKSRLQRTVALSSTEAEYYAISETAKEIKFIFQILESIGIRIKLPIIVKVDNVGAIFMAENVTATKLTRHVDARYHYVREFIEEGFIQIIFVKSDDNKADGFTKNLKTELYEKHSESYLIEKNQIEKEFEVRKGVMG